MHFKSILKFLIPLILGLGLLRYLYKGIDIKEIKEVLDSGVDWKWILISLFFAIISHILRALRWRLQLLPIGVDLPRSILVNSIFGNYAVNLLFPRLGEVWRCNYISKQSKSTFSTILGSLVSERLFDILSVLIILVTAFIIHRHFFLGFLDEHLFSKEMTYLMPWLGCLLVVFYVILILLYICRERILNSSLALKVKSVLGNIVEGVMTIKMMDKKTLYLFYTIGIWFFYFMNFYVCLWAFNFTSHIGVSGGLILFAMGSLAVIAPVQGGTGPWHFMIITTLVYLGVASSSAAIFALVVHAIQQLFVLILGLYAFISINLCKKIFNKTSLSV